MFIKSHQYIFCRFLCLILAVMFFMPVGAMAASVKTGLKDLVVADSESSLLLYLVVENGFKPEMETGIMNGIPVTFTFLVSLSRVRTGWPDSEEVALTFDHTLRYDNLKEEFMVQFGENNRIFYTKSLAEAKKKMSEVNGVALISKAELDESGQYLLKVKASLARKTLPLYIHYLIPFWSMGDFETDTYEIKLNFR